MRRVVVFLLVGAVAGCNERPSGPAPGPAPDDADARATAAARKELEAVFAERVRAIKAKDAAAQIALISPDYSAVLPNGQKLDYEGIKSYLRKGTEQFIAAKDLTITIENIAVKGDEAIVDARQRFSRTQRLSDGRVHEVSTGVLQNETWVKTPGGWKLKSVTDLREQTTTVDGKAVDPGKQ